MYFELPTSGEGYEGEVGQLLGLGPNLPAHEIAAAAKQCGAKTIGLSIVFPDDDPGIATELSALRREVGPLPIIIGGRAAMSYLSEIEAIGAKILPGLSQLRSALSEGF